MGIMGGCHRTREATLICELFTTQMNVKCSRALSVDKKQQKICKTLCLFFLKTALKLCKSC